MKPGSEKECAHVPCRCPAEPGSAYCSDKCRNAVGKTDCECGHAECLALAFKEDRNDAKIKI